MPNDNRLAAGRPLMAAEVAAAFGAHPGTVNKWARDGKIPHFRTPGGGLRFREAEIRPLLNSEPRP